MRLLCVLLVALAPALIVPVSAAESTPPINVILITVDTLRADHLGVYGHKVDTTPTIDRFAKRAVRFADATVQWPKTWPSIASLMTSLYPETTTIRFRPRRRLPERLTTVAEILKGAGYRTAAVIANVTVGKEFNYNQGFDVYVESWVDAVTRMTGASTFKNAPGRVKLYTNATIVTDKALALLGEMDDKKPFFLWLHYIDPHGPYLPPKKYAKLFTDAYPVEPVASKEFPRYQRQPDARVDRGAHDVGYYKAQYDRLIRYFDDELARLLAVVDTKQWKERTLLVLTADHGEALGEHQYYFEHGATPFQPTARVPLLMALDKQLPAGHVVEQPVGLIDIVPTILDLAGVPAPPLAGRSLVPLIRGQKRADPYVFMEAGHHHASQLVVRRGSWKLVRARNRYDKRRWKLSDFTLFNLEADPGESANLVGEERAVALELKQALARWQQALKGKDGTETVEPEPVKELDPATKEMMRALGYED